MEGYLLDITIKEEPMSEDDNESHFGKLVAYSMAEEYKPDSSISKSDSGNNSEVENDIPKKRLRSSSSKPPVQPKQFRQVLTDRQIVIFLKLWKKYYKRIENALLKKDIIEQLCHELEEKINVKVAVKEIQTKIKYFKSRYKEEIKKKSSGTVCESEWIHYKFLTGFLEKPEVESEENRAVSPQNKLLLCTSRMNKTSPLKPVLLNTNDTPSTMKSNHFTKQSKLESIHCEQKLDQIIKFLKDDSAIISAFLKDSQNVDRQMIHLLKKCENE